MTADASVESFRPVGEVRVWSFFSKQATFGQLVSIVRDRTTINGREALVIEEDLEIDYSQIGTERRVKTTGELYLSPGGFYLGTSYEIGSGDAAERLELRRTDEAAEGYFTRAGQKVESAVAFTRDLFAWDANFVDQLELLLAMRDIKVGESFEDSIFSPQSMLKMRVSGTTVDWLWQEIYKDKFDSVFVIEITEPQDYELYFTADKRLLRVKMVNRDIRVYQDMIQMLPTASQQSQAQERAAAFSLRALFLRLPHYVAYLVVAALSVLFLSRPGLKWLGAYAAFLVGAALFVLMPFTQMPLQRLLANAWLVPHATAGDPLYFWGVFPPLAGGLIQEVLKLGVLFGFVVWFNPGKSRCSLVGACLGAGFGFVESCYVAGWAVSPLFAWGLFERAFMILFHAAAGALVGNAIVTGGRWLAIAIMIVILTNTVFRYLPLFVQQGNVAVELMHFILAFVALGFLLFAILTLKVTTQAK